MNTIGMMKDFNVKPFIEAAEELLRADETERALNLLNNLPGYHRDHEPIEVWELRKEIHRRIATASFYATSDGCEITTPPESCLAMAGSLRGAMVIRDVSTINAHGLVPHIIDFAPGEYWLPMVLTHANLKFTYRPAHVNHISYKHYENRWNLPLNKETHASPRPNIFVAGEVIEHLWNEEEIRHQMIRECGLADIVHISTPCYAFDTQEMDWKHKADLGHLRSYTPGEFKASVTKLFPEYTKCQYESQIQHFRCVLNNTQFPFIFDSRTKNLFEAEALAT